MREEAKKRQLLRDKKRKKEEDSWKQMETAGKAAVATSAGEEPLRMKKK